MTSFHVRSLAATLFLALSAPAAAVTLALSPSAQDAAPGDPVSLDLVVSGLGDFAPDSLGDFEVDVAFDPVALGFSGYTLGTLLGDVSLGEAGDFSGGDSGGAVNLAVSTFLETDRATCVFCVEPYLDEIQPASFVLATLDFVVGALPDGATTDVVIDAVPALGDGFGVALALDATSGASVSNPGGGSAPSVPEPATWLLAGAGVLVVARRRGRGPGA